MRKVGTIYIETKYDITEWEWGRIRSRNHTDTLFLFVVGFFYIIACYPKKTLTIVKDFVGYLLIPVLLKKERNQILVLRNNGNQNHYTQLEEMYIILNLM